MDLQHKFKKQYRHQEYAQSLCGKNQTFLMHGTFYHKHRNIRKQNWNECKVCSVNFETPAESP